MDNTLVLPPHPITTIAMQREDQRAKREAIKQGVLDALIREARLLDKTVPTSFFEPTLRKLSLKNASKVITQASWWSWQWWWWWWWQAAASSKCHECDGVLNCVAWSMQDLLTMIMIVFIVVLLILIIHQSRVGWSSISYGCWSPLLGTWPYSSSMSYSRMPSTWCGGLRLSCPPPTSR